MAKKARTVLDSLYVQDFLEVANGITGDVTGAVTGNADSATTAADTTGTATLSSLIVSSIQSLSGAGAINVTSLITELTTGAADALTMIDGTTVGQIKIIKMVHDGGDGTLTPTTLLDGATLTFDDTDYAILYWTASGWAIISANAALA